MNLSRPKWLQELAEGLNSPEELLHFVGLSPLVYQADNQARKLFSVRVPKQFAQKMRKNDPNDPLLLQAMANRAEFDEVEGFIKDPLDEQQAAAPNILHKYHNRLLFMLKNSCAINCRYCFRRHFPYEAVKNGKRIWQQGLAYIAEHTELEEIILSGGDPLMAKDEELDWFLTQLEQIPHIQYLRIHTRLPVVIPSRITTYLCERLAKSRFKVVLVTHINHPNEIDEELAEALKLLIQAKVTLLNQSVLLKGINDNAMVLKTLSDKLFSVGILPYYLHLLDKVKGASHFYLPDEQAKAIYQQLQKITAGYLVPKLVREIGGEPNKTLIG